MRDNVAVTVGAIIAIVAVWVMDPLGAVALAGLLLVYIGSLKLK